MIEQVIRFGPDQSLVGVYTTGKSSQPEDPSDNTSIRSHQSQAPLAVLWNAGIVHRVGPFRLNVDVARALANAGYSACRFDLSGLGDSPSRKDNLDGTQRALQDGQDLLDHLQQTTGAQQFILIGLCSGSYHAHQLSLVDSRVVGAVFIDGFTFPTAQHRWRQLQRKLQPRFLRNAVKRRFFKLKAIDRLNGTSSGANQNEFFGADVEASTVTEQLQCMIDQGKQLMCIYTGGNPDISSAEQFSEMFPITFEPGQVQVNYLQQAEHTFPLVQSRQQLIELIVGWYQDQFPIRSSEIQDFENLASDNLAFDNAAQQQSCISPWAWPPSELLLSQL